MKGLQMFLFIFMITLADQTTAQQDVCPPWFIPDNTSITECSCHQDGAKVYTAIRNLYHFILASV